VTILTVNETFVLMLALKAGSGPLRYQVVYEAVGERAWTILNKLRRHGAIKHLRYNQWKITEKGLVAAALAMRKDPKLAEAFGITQGANP
jgi:hypothetical protein